MPIRLKRLGAVALAVSACVPARAGPPYVTDDPEPTDRGKWESYAFVSGTIVRGGEQGGSGFDINYGGAKDLQLSAVVSLAYARQTGAGTHVGVADTELGAKYRLVHQRAGSWLPDISLFPKIELPTAGRRFGSGRAGFSIPIWAQKDIGAWSLFGGGGWTRNPGLGNRDYGFGGLAVTRAVTPSLSLGTEIYHQTADTFDARSSTGLDLGASWQFAPKWSLIGSGGPLIEHRAATGRYAFYAALEFHD
ncbi:hypothetical protein [Sphingomonas morindae]|uniref:Cellulose biosynthesis protein BcsS n=1 Tax=Sphingomonas morindae TaxID=1541170 RepID=A0ABY4X7A5_9SPHN|nr:hypothetical protein [Sphingomonas morindae]USI72809.1 hypothetical protein LHA26_16305 [Sphingomonas morindae]